MGRRWWVGLGLIVTVGTLSCGSDDSGSQEPEAGEAAYEVGWDGLAEAASITAAVSHELTAVVDDGPMMAELSAARAIDYQCGQTAAGTCPTVTATCDGMQVTGAQLEYKALDACTDSSGAAVQGTVVFTRNALRDWTAELQAFQRSGWTYDGEVGLKTASGEPWSVTLTDLRVQGSLEETTDDPACTKSCVKSTTVSVGVDVAVSTPTAFSVDISPVTDKSVTVNGALAITGTVTGHVTILAKGPMGGDQTALDQAIDTQLDAQTMAVTDVTYGIPPACTCPASGKAESTSTGECGTGSITFSTAGQAECPTVVVAYETSSTFCDATASAVARTIGAKCKPLSP